jgi:hypothetical protein
MAALTRRDSALWTVLVIAALGVYGLAHTRFVSPADVELLKDIGALAGVAFGVLRASPLGPGRVRDMEEPWLRSHPWR